MAQDSRYIPAARTAHMPAGETPRRCAILRHANIWIGEHRLSGLNIVIGEFRRASTRTANASRGRKPYAAARHHDTKA